MIAPPVSRLHGASPTSMPSGRLAGGSSSPGPGPAFNSNGGGNGSARRPTVTGATGGNGMPSRTNTMAGGAQNGDSDVKYPQIPGVPLMQRQAAHIVGDVHPWTLNFRDLAMEYKYRQDTSELFSSAMQRLTSSCMFVSVLGIAVDIPAVLDSGFVDPNILYAKFALIGVSFLFALILMMIRRRENPFGEQSQRLFGVLFFLIVATWTVGNELQNDSAGRPSQSAAIILMLIAGHFNSHTILFETYSASSAAGAVVYIILAIVFRAETIPRTIFNLILVVCSWVLLSRAHYGNEYASRLQFVHSVKAVLFLQERNAMKKDFLDLRDEVFKMTLQKYGIADLDNVKLELKSPLEQAMAKLQGIQKKRVILPNDIFNDIQEAISCLGTSSDIFKPQISKEIARKGLKIDDDTERWITDLVNGDTGATTDKEKDGNGKDKALSPTGHGASFTSHILPNPRPGSGVRQSSMMPGGLPGSIPMSSLPGSIPLRTKEEKQYLEILEGVDDWNYDVFNVSQATKGKPIIFLGMALFKRYNLISKFNFDRTKLTNFLTAVESGYHSDAPYHNSTHAADVARTVHFFLESGKLRECMTDIEILGALIASLVHDYDHPGRTNAYHIAIRDEKAILYNDRSVLENHHCSQAFMLLRKEENNILSHFTTQQFVQLRKIIVELVLATDLGVHFDFLGQFKSVAVDKSNEKSRLNLLKMSLKCADLGHSAKILPLHEKWTLRITEEFYRQGDDERKANIPISPFMDRSKANVPQAQVGFMDFLVMPMFSIWVPVLNLPLEQFPCNKQLTENRNYWKKQVDKQKEGAENLLQTTTTNAGSSSATSTSSSSSSTAASGTASTNSVPSSTSTTVQSVSLPPPSQEIRVGLPRGESRSNGNSLPGGVNITIKNTPESKMQRQGSR